MGRGTVPRKTQTHAHARARAHTQLLLPKILEFVQEFFNLIDS